MCACVHVFKDVLILVMIEVVLYIFESQYQILQNNCSFSRVCESFDNHLLLMEFGFDLEVLIFIDLWMF